MLCYDECAQRCPRPKRSRDGSSSHNAPRPINPTDDSVHPLFLLCTCPWPERTTSHCCNSLDPRLVIFATSIDVLRHPATRSHKKPPTPLQVHIKPKRPPCAEETPVKTPFLAPCLQTRIEPKKGLPPKGHSTKDAESQVQCSICRRSTNGRFGGSRFMCRGGGICPVAPMAEYDYCDTSGFLSKLLPSTSPSNVNFERPDPYQGKWGQKAGGWGLDETLWATPPMS